MKVFNVSLKIYKTKSVIFLNVYPYFLLVAQREKQQVEEALRDVRRNEEEMCQSNQSLLTRLEDVQVKRGCCSVLCCMSSLPLSSHVSCLSTRLTA